MKQILVPCLAFAISALPCLASTVATPPVGFTTITIPANSVKAISIPLDQIPDFQGAVTGVTATTITTSTAAWTSTQFGPFASNPHVVRMLSGTSLGRHFKVSSNNATTLTITLPPGITDASTVIAPGDTYELVPVDTLASFFGTGGSSSVLTNSNSALADNVLIRGTYGWLTYFNNGTQWQLQAGGSAVQDNVALLPEAGILFVRNGSTPISFVISGQVPISNLMTDFPGASVSFLANRFPTDTTLSSLGLQSLPNWVSNSNSAVADNVLIRGTYGWLTYYYDGSQWLLQAGGQTPQNPTISSGTAVLVVHHSSQPLSLTQALPYSL